MVTILRQGINKLLFKKTKNYLINKKISIKNK